MALGVPVSRTVFNYVGLFVVDTPFSYAILLTQHNIRYDNEIIKK